MPARRTVPDGGFWKDRRVLLTGHTGFVGSWMSIWLSALGARLSGIALPPPTTPSLFDLAGLGSRFVDSRMLDVRAFEAIAAAVSESRPEIVFHLAAQPLVIEARRDPLGTFEVNVMGTANVLEAIRRAGSASTVVVFTTDKVYENRETDEAYTESARLGGNEPYGLSKACAEHVVTAWRDPLNASGTPGVASVRAGNILGGGDWARDRILPDAVRAWCAGDALLLRHPGAVRPWQHVLDALRGILVLGERLAEDPRRFAGAWNFGPVGADATTVGELAALAASAWGRGARWQQGPSAGHGEATTLRLDSSKAAQHLGWSAAWDASACVKRAINWYTGQLAGASASALCEREIEEHIGLAVVSGESQ